MTNSRSPYEFLYREQKTNPKNENIEIYIYHIYYLLPMSKSEERINTKKEKNK